MPHLHGMKARTKPEDLLRANFLAVVARTPQFGRPAPAERMCAQASGGKKARVWRLRRA
jgi:hypothetical protein